MDIRITEMAGAGGLWPTFAARWTEMEASFLSECGGKLPAKGDDWSAPKTAALMSRIHDQAYAADKPDFTEIKLGGKLGGVTMRMSK